ncbi:unnamed protein product [Durusdinium trenchii]|uniref:Uncharacterized protein n=1 Tax=Durusdinium trenchii TaxID=1381693 RepID=A0ABP0PHJ3_9DINO
MAYVAQHPQLLVSGGCQPRVLSPPGNYAPQPVLLSPTAGLVPGNPERWKASLEGGRSQEIDIWTAGIKDLRRDDPGEVISEGDEIAPKPLLIIIVVRYCDEVTAMMTRSKQT